MYPDLPGYNTTWGEVKMTLCSGLDLMSYVDGQQWGLLGFEHERIEGENKSAHKAKEG